MKGLILLTLALIGVVLSAASEKDLILNKFMDNKKELFKVYHLIYNKGENYKLDSDEGLRRYKIFKENLKWIKENNAIRGAQVYGITEFSDMTNEEYKEKILMKASEVEKLILAKPSKKETPKGVSAETTALNVDWRSKMGPIKKQGSCRSFWAFGATGALEGNFNIKFGQLNNYSEQYLLDCDNNDNGCIAGYPKTTFEWIRKNGVIKQSEVPYNGLKLYCDTDLKKKAMDIIEKVEYCESCDRTSWSELLKQGPITVIMDASDEGFKNYHPQNEEPWIPSRSCGLANHVAVAVGSVLGASGEEILIVRNSWGTDWGINGYFKVPASKSCGIIDNGWLPIPKRPVPLPTPTCPIFYSNCDKTGKTVSNCEGISDFYTAFDGYSVKTYDNNGTEGYPWNFYPDLGCRGQPLSKYGGECLDEEQNAYYSGTSTYNAMPGWACAALYAESCRTGKRVDLCGNIPDLSKAPGFPRKIGSITGVSGGPVLAIVFFEKPNYLGKAYGIRVSGKLIDSLDNSDGYYAIQNAQSVGLVYELA